MVVAYYTTVYNRLGVVRQGLLSQKAVCKTPVWGFKHSHCQHVCKFWL